jgi:RNA polymerase sigma-54 factor
MDNRRPYLRQSLDLRLSQRLALTPSLLQKIELLQLNKLELQDMLTQALIDNPILEEVTEPEPPKDLSVEEKAPDVVAESGDREKDSFEEIDFQYFFDEYLDTGYRNREVEDPEKPSFETFLVRPPSLTDHLTSQLGLTETDERTAAIAREIIGNLDEGWYLLLSMEELCGITSATPEEAESALKLVQSFDPIGVAARDLKECLQIGRASCRERV